ncbi:hypothetical protein SE17_22280 [Kouleothrix aurantiaca]|uniref:HTH arsR-type domain-containing protein n=1 Tax=Kouleothrix aurantiaca TaxID=186479 RepID=A0A0N8PRY9_9CHLR|nr:hypothetical protein SE17_22280 [Kouleothrix aurantiaca]
MIMRQPPPTIFKLLGHDVRWQIVRALARGDCRVGDLCSALAQPANLLSYHMGQLRAAALVRERRSDADGRDSYYQLDLLRLREQVRAAGLALHPALLGGAPGAAGSAGQRRVLFLCTQNSARSQMAEALLRAHGGGMVACSAGSQPSELHPAAQRALERAGFSVAGLRAKHHSEFAGQAFDYVVTMCDRVREQCPPFAGGAAHLHWSIADPVAQGDDQAFDRTLRELAARIANFVAVVDWEEEHETTRTDPVHRELGPLADG